MSLIFLLICSSVELKKFMIDYSQIWRISLIDLWKVKIYYGRSKFYYEQCRFYYEWSRYVITGRYFVMSSRDFDSDMTGRNFCDDRLRFCYERSQFLRWQVEIFMITGQDFNFETLRFSPWQIEIFMIIPGREFWVNSGAQRGHLAMQIWWATAWQGSRKSWP